MGHECTTEAATDARRLHVGLLVHAGRLLLEYNESTAEIHRALTSTSRVLTDEACHIAVSYGGVAVTLGEKGAVLVAVHEIRYNAAVQARVHAILAQVRHGQLEPATALAYLDRVEGDTPRHSRWVSIFFLGIAAASLAALLGADVGAGAVAGLATAAGLFVRHELGRWHFSLLALPLAAALVGSILGGLAIRLGWTRTPELVLIVPALMLVPGPHLINGLLDLIDNHVPMSIARLGLALGILFASALGIALGVELTLQGSPLPDQSAQPERLNVVSDAALAGIVTCGFAVFYNTAWRHVGMAALGGMAGHGLRYLALESHANLETATFLGGLAVGIISGGMARSGKVPVAVVAFAGAVTMIPGLNLYRALAGARQLAHLSDTADASTLAATLGNAWQGGLVICGLTLGLIFGTRTVRALANSQPKVQNGTSLTSQTLTRNDP
jgi:uncharacterized membrane protein YjjP (DUF1212 family)